MADILKFFEEKPDPQGEVVPTFAEVFKEALNASKMETRVAMPAEVIKYDHKKQAVDVRPFFQRKGADGKSSEAPIIYNVPVAFPRAGDAFISMPIEKGNSIMLIFADRSMDKWLSSGAHGDPEDTRAHHISDAIALPGLYPFSNTAPVHNANDVIIKNKNLEIRIKKNGHLQILNSKHELIKVIDEWMTADINGAHTFKLVIRDKLRTFLEK